MLQETNKVLHGYKLFPILPKYIMRLCLSDLMYLTMNDYECRFIKKPKGVKVFVSVSRNMKSYFHCKHIAPD